MLTVICPSSARTSNISVVSHIFWLQPGDPADRFPPAETALQDPPGLLAMGGDLSMPRLLAGYARGIFPWFSEGQPILWWSPDPRAVLGPAELKISRSLAKRLRAGEYQTHTDRDFTATIAACAAPRANSADTWITAEMRAAYQALHHAGYAHSVETWCDGELVGGLYGVHLGGVFFGESMFSRRTDASKVALVRLVAECGRRSVAMIDCQMATRHLASLGVRTLPRRRFLALLRENCRIEPDFSWFADNSSSN
jgi:leucyl/phenylalanyl-tRNA---protein transferase